MDYLDMLIDSLNRVRERFWRMFKGVTVEQANCFPVADTAPQIKSLTWLAWHTARELICRFQLWQGRSPSGTVKVLKSIFLLKWQKQKTVGITA